MLHKIEDESGQTWYVGKGDPCHELVQKLHTRHYTWVVLPRALIWGSPPHPKGEIWMDCNWRYNLRFAHRLGYNSQGGRRHLRLAECLRVLSDGD